MGLTQCSTGSPERIAGNQSILAIRNEIIDTINRLGKHGTVVLHGIPYEFGGEQLLVNHYLYLKQILSERITNPDMYLYQFSGFHTLIGSSVDEHTHPDVDTTSQLILDTLTKTRDLLLAREKEITAHRIVVG